MQVGYIQIAAETRGFTPVNRNTASQEWLPKLLRCIAVVFAVFNGERESETAQSTAFGFVMVHSVPLQRYN